MNTTAHTLHSSVIYNFFIYLTKRLITQIIQRRLRGILFNNKLKKKDAKECGTGLICGIPPGGTEKN
jgi:hypothetical protein